MEKGPEKKKGEKKALQLQIIQLLFPLNLEVKNTENLHKILSNIPSTYFIAKYVGKINQVSFGFTQ